jgi:membrane protein
MLVLIGLVLLLAASLATAFATTVRLVVGIAVNTLLSTAVLTGLPRLRVPPRRVVLPALLVAVGLELLKTVGGFYVQRTEANPTYQVVAGIVGLLVFLNVVNQLILFAAALTATSTTGDVTDLAVRPRSPWSSGDQDTGPAEPTTGSDTSPVHEQTRDRRHSGRRPRR